uniref:FYVE-type domain-containing protein n=1 Tax=Oryza glumipatula TaxID=40148 RepID=A0A0D9YPP9_9ORYZ
MAGAERPYYPPRPTDGGSGQPAGCDSPVRWDDDDEDHGGGGGDGMTAVAGFNLFEEESDDPPAKNGVVDDPDTTTTSDCNTDMSEDLVKREEGMNFHCDPPLHEHTGIWVPVSVPPMTKRDHEEWHKGFGHNGDYFPEDEFNWEIDEENKEMTMWDVFSEMVVAAKDKVISVASYDLGRCGMSMLSKFFFQEAWKDMAQTLADANAGIANELLETERTIWLPDSAASACMLCNVRFHPIMCSRHHCRFCGGVFCGGCSKGRSLMPPKFNTSEPQRVCDVCGVRLESIQPYLMNRISRASQPPTHDVTDLSTLRSWLNFPYAHTMEYEIYKAANSLNSYCKVGRLKPEKAIPYTILKQAKGLAIITVAKVGMMVAYKVGTGLVIARRADGSWSPPSAIATCGIGYGAQAGGELADFIIVLRNTEAVKTFSGKAHLSVGAGVSASVGHVGRVAEADFRAGDGGYAACYTYSCSKGAFVGCALNGSLVSTRDTENARFYGGPIKAPDILMGSMARPPAAAALYKVLSELFDNPEKQSL